MAVYGIIMEWDEHTTQTGEHIPRGDFFFVSPDAENYIEVENLRQFYDTDRTEELETHLAGKTEGKTRTVPMCFARRFFAQQETIPECRVTMDSRITPPITNEELETTGGLPADVKYPNLGKEKART